MDRRSSEKPRSSRRAAILVLSAFLIVIMMGMIAMAVDLGYIVLVRTQLQAAADAAAMAGAASLGKPFDTIFANAERYADLNSAGRQKVQLLQEDVELGVWDTSARRFTPSADGGNAVRVTARRDKNTGGEAPLFFGRIFGMFSFSNKATAVAMANPRDIAFVVDLSGSMNDDTEPCWATDAENSEFASEGYPTIGNELMQQVYEDFGYGSFPGKSEYVGEYFGVAEDEWAYAELTKDKGPLADKKIDPQYRISTKDDEATRKLKAYAAIIDFQIARVMPAAKPTPSSAESYAYWEKYLDYIMQPVTVSGGGRGKSSSSAGTPPNNRGTLPPNQDSDRITGFNNPNRSTFPSASPYAARAFWNQIGYRTYVQYMMDFGRDLKPTGSTYVPLSRHSPDCPWHSESTPGGTFRFPPREQPTHASRRALIAAMQVVRERNRGINDPDQSDWVSVITFDALNNGGPVIQQSLTPDYTSAMDACTTLQAVGDKGASTATEAGLIAARDHIKSKKEGGEGRLSTNKVIVLLTDGVPNLYVSSSSEISSYIASNSDPDYYSGYANAYNAPLMQIAQMEQKKWSVFPVGIGLGTDYDFMDRMARMGGTADDAGQGPRGSGNPAEYEQRLTDIFREIITNPQVRLVQ